MKDDDLATYLNDHLGASVVGIELTRRCLSNNRDSELGKFLETLLLVMHEEQVRLKRLLKRLGAGESAIKKAGGWAIEKVGRLKLNNSLFRYSALSRLIELEALMAGLQAQAGMWAVLEKTRSDDPRFEGIDLGQARRISEEMLDRVRGFHFLAAELAFGDRGNLEG